MSACYFILCYVHLQSCDLKVSSYHCSSNFTSQCKDIFVRARHTIVWSAPFVVLSRAQCLMSYNNRNWRSNNVIDYDGLIQWQCVLCSDWIENCVVVGLYNYFYIYSYQTVCLMMYRSVPLIGPPILYTTSSPKWGGGVLSRMQLASTIRPLENFCYVHNYYDTAKVHVHSTNDRQYCLWSCRGLPTSARRAATSTRGP